MGSQVPSFHVIGGGQFPYNLLLPNFDFDAKNVVKYSGYSPFVPLWDYSHLGELNKLEGFDS